MPQMTLSQARVIDPILTTIAQGYKNADFVGQALFPAVPVAQRGGNILSFGKEDFQLYSTIRAPGAAIKRMQFGYSAGKFSLESHALEALVPNELLADAAAVPGLDLARSAINKVQNIIGLRLEYVQAQLATTAANYAATNKATLTGTAQWSDLAASDPLKDIETAKEAIRKQVGKRPNTIVLSAAVFAMLRQHSKIIDRIKYTGRDVPTAELLASLFGVKQVLVGDAIYDNNGTFADVWGKSVVIAYTEMASLADMGAPTFGYTYRLNGHPLVTMPYQDRNANSWIYQILDEVAPVIAGASAGYLISNAVA